MSGKATVLAFDRVTPVEELADGLAWVRWLLQSVRARREQVAFHPPSLKGATIHARWEEFATAWFAPLLGPHMKEAWQHAFFRDLDALVECDRALDSALPEAFRERSREAGAVLLRSTRGARYQGVLGHYRAAVEAGSTPGNFIIVWAAVGNFFQLSLSNVLAEYLRMEWEMGTREFSNVAEPERGASFTRLVGTTLNGAATEPALVRREG